MQDSIGESKRNAKIEKCHQPELVSVIIPTYNRSKLVTRAVESALQQTYPNCEIIVVDDGSTDDTREILGSYKDRIKYIYQENSGQGVARNTGIRAARGKWIAFLDSDDIWLPEKLSRQMEILTRSNAKVSYTNMIWNSKVGDISSSNKASHKNPNYEVKVFDEPLDLILFGRWNAVVSSLVVERNLLFRMGCFDERVKTRQDRRLCLRLAFETPFAYLNQPLLIFDRRPEVSRITADRSLAYLKEASCVDAITRSEAYFQSGGKSRRIVKDLRHQLGHYVSKMALCACVENNNSAAGRFALDGLYFGGDWRTYRRCIAVLFFPWLVRKFGRNHETS